jgi:hypothetical protein
VTFEAGIEEAQALGERLSQWIARINADRTAETAIRLTSPQTRRGIPIERPNVYSPSIIAEKTKEILAELPKEMRSVLLSNTALPASPVVTDEVFIRHGRLIDRNYQQAVRYKLVNQNRAAYEARAAQDVRGYHYLMTNKITAEDLRDVALIPEDKVEPIRLALTQLCRNTRASQSDCENRVNTGFRTNRLAELYNQTYGIGKATWDNFFVIPSFARRRDIRWGTETVVPFNTPELPRFIPYLRDNIEDEFRWQGWRLTLNFGTFANGPRLVFRPNTVPHVNGLGGNQIVMDSNQPIEEYESQWTIRHEFGHVLGLPDCYHEFYDVKLQAYVNYQLDITDLMCSRAGDMNERIYLELKKAYDR